MRRNQVRFQPQVGSEMRCNCRPATEDKGKMLGSGRGLERVRLAVDDSGDVDGSPAMMAIGRRKYQERATAVMLAEVV